MFERVSSLTCTNCGRPDASDLFQISWHSPLCYNCAADERVGRASGVFRGVDHPSFSHELLTNPLSRIFYSDSDGSYWGFVAGDWALCVISPNSSPEALVFPRSFLHAARADDGGVEEFARQFRVPTDIDRFWDGAPFERSVAGWASSAGWVGAVIEVRFSPSFAWYSYCEYFDIDALHHPLVISHERPDDPR